MEEKAFERIHGYFSIPLPKTSLALEKDAQGARVFQFFHLHEFIGLIDEIPQFRILAAAELIQRGPFAQEMVQEGMPVCTSRRRASLPPPGL